MQRLGMIRRLPQDIQTQRHRRFMRPVTMQGRRTLETRLGQVTTLRDSWGRGQGHHPRIFTRPIQHPVIMPPVRNQEGCGGQSDNVGVIQIADTGQSGDLGGADGARIICDQEYLDRKVGTAVKAADDALPELPTEMPGMEQAIHAETQHQQAEKEAHGVCPAQGTQFLQEQPGHRRTLDAGMGFRRTHDRRRAQGGISPVLRWMRRHLQQHQQILRFEFHWFSLFAIHE